MKLFVFKLWHSKEWDWLTINIIAPSEQEAIREIRKQYKNTTKIDTEWNNQIKKRIITARETLEKIHEEPIKGPFIIGVLYEKNRRVI